MKHYNLVNNLLGWVAFAIAAITYCMTVEPTASFWDCPEFITTASKLEVGHPPGAPFFMLTGNFFTLFSSDPTTIAYCVNIMSALLSALCILFLFWTITHLARKLICENGVVKTVAQTVAIMGAGMTGALAYTWSDTFWFSAVEGEVYAYSSFLTALTFWLILKWENHADEPHSDRWLVLIFYVTGLSIGVHLLNLLCLPAIVLVYYFHKQPNAQLKGSVMALCVSALLVVAVLYGVVPGIVKVGGEFEWFFVNSLGMSFNSGMIIYILLLIGVVLTAVWSTTRSNRNQITVLYLLSVSLLGIPFIGHGMKAFGLGLLLLAALAVALVWKKDGEYLLRKRFLNTSLLCMLMLMIGYSSYAVIVVRSVQNPPMDQNSPEDVFTLGSYLNREQYGNRPLFYGESYLSDPSYYYTQNPDDILKESYIRRADKQYDGDPDRYEELQRTKGYVYPSGMQMFFPRMYSSAAHHVEAYNSWLGLNPEDPQSREGLFSDFREVKFKVNRPDGNGYETPLEYYGIMPTQWTNFRYFMSYQVNFMYWRYFLWNFAGRQNDIQGNGEMEHGNFITGIPFVDNMIYGDQDALPDELKNNKGHNVFYCLPLLLGLIGLFWQAYRGQKGIQQFWVVFFLFFMTGLAIVLYLNQTPMQPRERDYAYAGSFYAFAIWIGLGVLALYEGFNRLREKFNLKAISPVVSASLVTVICLLVPVQMVSQTWDDHDRSGRYACRDFGKNYLSTLTEKGNPVIFTNGDNDTFPLWYAQDVESYRTDSRVCNLSYLNTDWYIDQMRRPSYESPALPIDWASTEYIDNKSERDVINILNQHHLLNRDRANNPAQDPYELSYLIDHYARPQGFLPTDSFVVTVNKDAVRKSDMTLPYGPDSIPDKVSITLKGKRHFTKSEMMMFEMIGRSHFARPLYMSVTLGESNYPGLKDYLVLEGMAYRLTPFKRPGAVDVDKMYDNLMNRFEYGNVKMDGIYLDETVTNMCETHRNMFSLLVEKLLQNGDKARALKALQKCKEVLPEKNIPYSPRDYRIAQFWSRLGQMEDAGRVAKSIARQSAQFLIWSGSVGYNTLKMKGARFLSDALMYWDVFNKMVNVPMDEASKKEIYDWKEKALQSPSLVILTEYFYGRSGSILQDMTNVLQISDADLKKENIGKEQLHDVFLNNYGVLMENYRELLLLDSVKASQIKGMMDQLQTAYQSRMFGNVSDSISSLALKP